MLLAVVVAAIAFAAAAAPAAASPTVLTTVPGVIVDATPTRVLWIPGGTQVPGPLRVRDVATGVDTVVPVPPGRTLESAPFRLFDDGVIFVTKAQDVDSIEIDEWHTGDASATSLGSVQPSSIDVAGRWLIWNSPVNPGHTLTRRDLDTGTNAVVATDAGNTENDVAESGDVVYWTANGTADQYEVYRWHDGVTTKVSDSPTDRWSTYPVTDGTNVVYRQKPPCCTHDDEPSAIVFDDFDHLTPATVLTSGIDKNGPLPGANYRVSDGWTAFTSVDRTEVVTRDDNDVETTVSTDGGSGALALSGFEPPQVLYVRNQATFLSAGTHHPFPVSASGHDGFVAGGRWYLTGGDGKLSRLDTDTAITKQPPAATSSRSADIELASSALDPTYECTLDQATLAGCDESVALDSLSDGQHTFTAASRDPSRSETDPEPASATWTVDATPPSQFALQAPADGSAVTSPVLSWAAADDGDGTGVESYEVTLNGQSAGTTPADETTLDLDGLRDGNYTWSVRVTDAAGNHRDSATHSFTLDRNAPSVPQLTVADGTRFSTQRPTLTWEASTDDGSGVTGYDVLIDGTTAHVGAGDTSFAPGADLDEGDHWWQVVAIDAAGNRQPSTSGWFRIYTHDPLPGPAGISINDGAQYTNDPHVTLTLRWPLFSSSMLLSNDGGFGGSEPQEVASEVPWTLASSGPERLPKTAYVRYLGGLNGDETYQDDIILDETSPEVASAYFKRGARVRGRHKLRRFRIRLRAADTVSGVVALQLTANRAHPGARRPYRRVVSVRARRAPRWIRVFDRAGNRSKWRRLKHH